MIEMDRDAIEIIGPERALLAPFLPIGSEHEVIDDQMGAPVEEIAEREGAPRTGKTFPRAPTASPCGGASAHRVGA